MLLLRESDVQALLAMQELIPVVEAAFRDWAHARAVNSPRRRVHVPQGTLHLMPAAWTARGYLGFKAYTSFATRTRFHFFLYAADSGEPLALIEADRLGQMRTGATSAVATRYLARAEAQVLGILGTGWQAEAQLEAICCVRPIQKVYAYSRDSDRRADFCRRMSQRLNVPVEPVESAREAVSEADILVTATTSRDPILTGEMLRPGVHLNAIGANSLARREIETYAVARCDRIVVDDLEQARLEAAELLIPIELRRLSWERVHPLAGVVGGLLPGRETPEQITLFKSLGIALEDVAAAALVYEKALQHNRGEHLG